MQVRILGGSSAMLPLLKAIRDGEAYQVVGWYDSEEITAELREWFPHGRLLGSGEDLTKSAEGGLVLAAAGGDESTCEGVLRDLARQSTPLVLIQPACSAIFAFELDMIQRDTGAPIIPIYGPALHPMLDQLAHWIASSAASPVGQIEQIVFERATSDRSDAAVRSALARDGLLLRRIVGDFQQVGALKTDETSSLANLNVHVTSSANPITRWSVVPAVGDDECTLTLIGETGKVTLTMPANEAWSLTTSGDQEIPEIDSFDQPEAILDFLQQGLARNTSYPNWEDACRAIDLSDVAGESVRRKKTLTISNERLTEEDTFKGMMAAGGCLILMVLPLILLVVALVDGLQIPFGKHLIRDVEPGQTQLQLPTDLKVVQRVAFVDDGAPLAQLPPDVLKNRYANEPPGTPAAYSVRTGSLTLAPAPASPLQLDINYKGSFTVWAGWPLLLLLPILFFLMLQLLKFVFPQPATENTSKLA